MYEQTPEFFKKFLRNFRYHICLEEPRVGKDLENDICYAFGLHSEQSEYCYIEQKHYQLLESGSKFQNRGRWYAVPCLYSTFSFLIHSTSYLKLNSDTIEKLNRAVSHTENPHNKSPFFRNTKRIRKRVPVVRNRNERSSQISNLSPIFLNRLNLILDGHHAALFYRIVDFFISGFDTINNEFLAFHFDSSSIEK